LDRIVTIAASRRVCFFKERDAIQQPLVRVNGGLANSRCPGGSSRASRHAGHCDASAE